MAMRTEEEIAGQCNRASQMVDDGETRVPGLSYEEGVYSALSWATGFSDQPPMDDLTWGDLYEEAERCSGQG